MQQPQLSPAILSFLAILKWCGLRLLAGPRFFFGGGNLRCAHEHVAHVGAITLSAGTAMILRFTGLQIEFCAVPVEAVHTRCIRD